MLELKRGDILTEDAEALVNTVNCVGVMGRGIALQFKRMFPENFKAYKRACDQDEVRLGKMFVFKTGHLTYPRYIINFPTKQHWRSRSRIADIEAGLVDLVETIRELEIHSIAIPPLGSGLGGLEWKSVRPRIEAAMRSVEGLETTIYEPGGAPAADEIMIAKKAPNMTPGRAALVGLLHQYQSVLLDPFITLLEAHKLMYFMQEIGERLQLRYEPALYGPYAENLRHVFNAIEGHLLSGYADGGDDPNKELRILPGAVDTAVTFLEQHPATLERFNQVASLVEGFETQFGLELLSTVHWVAVHEAATTRDEIVEKTYAWSDRKRQFSERQIDIAIEALAKHQLLPHYTGVTDPVVR